MSFADLVKDRYGVQENSSYSGVMVLVSVIQVKQVPTLDTLELVSLKRSMLISAGESGSISRTCPSVRQLDISGTPLNDWQEVLNIVRELTVSFT